MKKLIKPKTSQNSVSRVTIQKTAAETSKALDWWSGATVGLRRSVWVLGLALICMALVRFEILEARHGDSLYLIMTVILFVLAMPLSVLFRLDSLALEWADGSNKELLLLILLAWMMVNFTLIGCARGALAEFRRKRQSDSGSNAKSAPKEG